MNRGLCLVLALIAIFVTGSQSSLRSFCKLINSVEESFEANGIVNDVIETAPTEYVTVIYPHDVEVQLGNELTPSQVQYAPLVLWEANPYKFYLLLMVDPDAPSRQDPYLGNVIHWIVANIPGNNLSAGDTRAIYIPSAPPANSGLHRYVFLVYEQPRKLKFNEPRLTNSSTDGRLYFSVTRFVEKYDLESPIAGNFYQSQYSGAV